jgi:hypothetical protein
MILHYVRYKCRDFRADYLVVTEISLIYWYTELSLKYLVFIPFERKIFMMA